MKLKEEYGNSEEEMRRTCESSDNETDDTQTSGKSSSSDEGCGGINWKMHVDAKGHKLLSESCVTDENDNTTVRVKPVENRDHVKFKTDNAIKELYSGIFEWLRLQNGSAYYTKQNLWDDVVKYGYSNLPKNLMSGLLRKYVELRRACSYVFNLEIAPPVDLNKNGRQYQMNLFLTKEQFELIEAIKKDYFIRSPIHPDMPYIMLIVSFINSDYKDNILAEFRDNAEPFYEAMLLNIKNLETTIYNLNVGILKNWRNFPVDKTHLWIDYLNYLTKYFDEKKDFTNPDILRQIELISKYCEYVSKYMNLFRAENRQFNVEEFGRLHGWTETKEIQRNS